MTDEQILQAIGVRQGLARAALFRAGETHDPEAHDVWLDGRHGSFLLSAGTSLGEVDAASWAWSTGVPHHIAIHADDLIVTRWDAPAKHDRFSRRAVLEDPQGFYASLHEDRVASAHGIVRHCLQTFRSIRTITFNQGLDDARSLDVYLAFLARLCSEPDVATAGPADRHALFDLPAGSVEILEALPSAEIDTVTSVFLRAAELRGNPRMWPRLAVRHAAGEIFQEAHLELVSRPIGPDLFAHVVPVRGRKPDRGTVHFTPSYLARALAEEAILATEGLLEREEIAIMDPACGSAAFIVEGLRALERFGYRGRVRVIGRDISATAVSMARFVVSFATREWPGPGRTTIDIRQGDTLREALPAADIILLNPPFAIGRDIDAETRNVVRSLLSLEGGHIDLSMAFITVAARSVQPGGALAALMPAKLLEAAGSAPWRKALESDMSMAFRATFANLHLFNHALVRVGAMVLTPGRRGRDCIELNADAHENSTGEALRALRRSRANGELAYDPEGRWTLRRREPASHLYRAKRSHTGQGTNDRSTTVTDLFDVLQGVRPGGYKRAFVRSKDEFEQLPVKEQTFYRRAITSKGIVDGRVASYVHIFYPYVQSGSAFASEEELKAAVPATYERYLRPWKKKLSSRAGKANRWWELTHPGRGIVTRSPLLFSKYFAGPGGFALDVEGVSLVEQGHAFDPKPGLRELFVRDEAGNPPEIALAYLAVLNTKAFFDGVSRYGDGMVVAGGQSDMSGRHLRMVPLMDLSKLPRDVPPLARYARRRYLDTDDVSGPIPSSAEVEDWVREALARARPGAAYRSQPIDGLPDWATHLLDLEGGDLPEATHVDIIEHLLALGASDAVEEVDEVLQRIPASGMSELALITLLRTTFGYKERLANWAPFRDRAEAELTQRGRPARKILIGLYA